MSRIPSAVIFPVTFFFVFGALPLSAFSAGEAADTNAANTSGTGGCNPGSQFDPKLPKSQTDSAGHQGLLGLGCVDPTSGVPGTCVAADVCEATKPAGQPTQQQKAEANNGNSANGTAAQGSRSSAASGGSSGATPQVSANPGTAPAQSSPAPSPSQSSSGAQPSSGGVNPNSPLLVDAINAYWPTNPQSAAQTPSQLPGGTADQNSFNAQNLSSQSNALSGQSPPQYGEPPASSGTAAPNAYEPSSSFSPTLSSPMGNLQGITEQQVQSANASTLPVDQQNTDSASISTYGVCNLPSGCNGVEGAPVTYSQHPDAFGNPTNQIYTLDGYGRGQYPYVTVAGAPNQQGDTGVFNQISYIDPMTGQSQTLQNVPYMVADTGKDFPNGSDKLDVPLTIPQSAYPSVTGSNAAVNAILDTQPINSQTLLTTPTDNLRESYALATWNTPAVENVPASQGVVSLSMPAWTSSPVVASLEPTVPAEPNAQPYPTTPVETASLPAAEPQFALASVESRVPSFTSDGYSGGLSGGFSPEFAASPSGVISQPIPAEAVPNETPSPTVPVETGASLPEQPSPIDAETDATVKAAFSTQIQSAQAQVALAQNFVSQHPDSPTAQAFLDESNNRLNAIVENSISYTAGNPSPALQSAIDQLSQGQQPGAGSSALSSLADKANAYAASVASNINTGPYDLTTLSGLGDAARAAGDAGAWLAAKAVGAVAGVADDALQKADVSGFENPQQALVNAVDPYAKDYQTANDIAVVAPFGYGLARSVGMDIASSIGSSVVGAVADSGTGAVVDTSVSAVERSALSDIAASDARVVVQDSAGVPTVVQPVDTAAPAAVTPAETVAPTGATPNAYTNFDTAVAQVKAAANGENLNQLPLSQPPSSNPFLAGNPDNLMQRLTAPADTGASAPAPTEASQGAYANFNAALKQLQDAASGEPVAPSAPSPTPAAETPPTAVTPSAPEPPASSGVPNPADVRPTLSDRFSSISDSVQTAYYNVKQTLSDAYDGLFAKAPEPSPSPAPLTQADEVSAAPKAAEPAVIPTEPAASTPPAEVSSAAPSTAPATLPEPAAAPVEPAVSEAAAPSPSTVPTLTKIDLPADSPIKTAETIAAQDLTPDAIAALNEAQAPEGYTYMYRGLDQSYTTPVQDQQFTSSLDGALGFMKENPDGSLVRIAVPTEDASAYGPYAIERFGNFLTTDVLQYPRSWFTSEIPYWETPEFQDLIDSKGIGTDIPWSGGFKTDVTVDSEGYVIRTVTAPDGSVTVTNSNPASAANANVSPQVQSLSWLSSAETTIEKGAVAITGGTALLFAPSVAPEAPISSALETPVNGTPPAAPPAPVAATENVPTPEAAPGSPTVAPTPAPAAASPSTNPADQTQPVSSANPSAKDIYENSGVAYDSGGQHVVLATCDGGGGACGSNSKSSAAGGTNLTGDNSVVAVPSNNPYGYKVGDTLNVCNGSGACSEAIVGDYTKAGSNNYVLSGGLEKTLGGTGSDAMTFSSVNSAAPIGQGGIGADRSPLNAGSLNVTSLAATPPPASVVQPPAQATGYDLYGENAAPGSTNNLNAAETAFQQQSSQQTNSQTQTPPSGGAPDIQTANQTGNDNRLQVAADQSPPPVPTPQPTPMQTLQSKLNNALSFVQQAQQAAQNGGNNNLTPSQYSYLRSIAAATGNAGSLPSYEDASSLFNGLGGGWTGIAGSRTISKIQSAISNQGH